MLNLLCAEEISHIKEQWSNPTYRNCSKISIIVDSLKVAKTFVCGSIVRSKLSTTTKMCYQLRSSLDAEEAFFSMEWVYSKSEAVIPCSVVLDVHYLGACFLC